MSRVANTDKSQNRFMELEGLRGIAAIAVAIYHNMLAFYAAAFLGAGSLLAPVQNKPFESVMYGNPLSALLSGTFAVAIFFVLSGFVLSIGYVQTKRLDIIKKLAFKRYFRLVIPVLGSVLLCYVLLRAGWSHTQDAGTITHSNWLLGYWNFIPHLTDAIKSTLLIFMSSHDAGAYNNVLWTMPIEFIGSFIIFGTLALFGKSRYRWFIYAALAIVTFNTWLLGFVVGMAIADLYAGGYIQQRRRNIGLLAGIIIGAIFFGGFPIGDRSHTLYGFFGQIGNHSLNFSAISLTIGATFLMFAALWSSQVAGVLRAKYISGFGKYTFALYLVHIPILYSYTTWIFTLLIHHMGYSWAALLSIISSIPIVAVTTYLFEKYVDAKAVLFASYCADIAFGKKQLDLRKKTQLALTRISQPIVRLAKKRTLDDGQKVDQELN